MLTKLGPFEILEVIGRGGMGTVYRGIDPIIGRPVAIKVIRLLGYNDSEEQAWLKDRLFREARAAGGLCHPGIVTIYHVGEEQDVAYIVMEFVDGPNLQEIMANEGLKDKDKLCRVLLESAAALDYAHKRGLVHRDIKPANIMVTASGITKVTDFGIAKTNLGQTATKTGMILGTPFYMSPEQIRGKALDGRSDQFALAVIAYEIVTGRKPFAAEQMTSVCYQIIHEEPLSAKDVNPGVGAEVAAVVKRGLAKEADARYATCTEFAEALLAAVRLPEQRETAALTGVAQPVSAPPISEQPEKTAPPTSAPFVAARDQSRNRLMLAGAALVVVAAGLWLMGHKKEPAVPEPPPVSDLRPTPIISGGQSPSSAVASQPVEIAAAPSPRAPIVPAQPTPAAATDEFKPSIEPAQESKPAPNGGKKSSAQKGLAIWTGHLAASGLLTIDGARASVGSLTSALPGRPVTIQVYPAESTGTGLTVFTSDSQYATAATINTPRGPATFTFDPRHATDIVLFEAPSAQNNWEHLVLRVNRKVSACVIEWSAE